MDEQMQEFSMLMLNLDKSASDGVKDDVVQNLPALQTSDIAGSKTSPLPKQHEEPASGNIMELSEQKTLLQLELDNTFKQLESIYRHIEQSNHQLKQDPLSAVIYVSGIEQQEIRIKQLIDECIQRRQRVQEITDRILLNDSLGERNLLINSLQAYDVIASFDDVDGHRHLKNILEEEMSLIHGYQDKLIHVQQHLAFFLSKENLDQKCLELQHLIEQIEKDLHGLEEDKRHIQLTDTIKSHLNGAFADSQQRAECIALKKEELDTLTSSLNVWSWYAWTFDTENYQETLQGVERELNFLLLVDKETTLHAEKATIQHDLEKIIALSSSIDDESIFFKAQDEGKQILNELKKYDKTLHLLISTALTSLPLSAYDLLKLLINSLAYIHNLYEKKQSAKQAIDQIIRLDKIITHLQIKHAILEHEDEVAIEKLHHDLEEIKRQDPVLKGQLTSCDEFLRLAGHYKEKLNALHYVQKLILHSKMTSEHMTSQLVYTPDSVGLHRDDPALEPFLLSAVQVECGDSSDLQAVRATLEDKKELLTLQKKIHLLSYKLPDLLKMWYVDLNQTLNDQVLSHQDTYRACQLLRDIYFELKYPIDDNYSVLKKYYHLCSDPKHQLHLFLPLKPSFTTSRKIVGEVRDQHLSLILDKLYAKSKKMNRQHHPEAKLLFQATQVIHQSALALEHNKERPLCNYSGFILGDERYNRLKKHRGFLKAWETIAFCYHFLLSGCNQQKVEQKPYAASFFKTQSMQLLLKAEENISRLSLERMLTG